MPEQPVPEGLHTVERSHAGAIHEELQPVGKTHVEAVHGELSPMGVSLHWNKGKEQESRSGRDNL